LGEPVSRNISEFDFSTAFLIVDLEIDILRIGLSTSEGYMHFAGVAYSKSIPIHHSKSASCEW
jgi:hypothetical protein